jgi:hypothetical protein
MRWFVAAACLLLLWAAAQQQQAIGWVKLPCMQLERQFAAPLQDTIIQRWRDPLDDDLLHLSADDGSPFAIERVGLRAIRREHNRLDRLPRGLHASLSDASMPASATRPDAPALAGTKFVV